MGGNNYFSNKKHNPAPPQKKQKTKQNKTKKYGTKGQEGSNSIITPRGGGVLDPYKTSVKVYEKKEKIGGV